MLKLLILSTHNPQIFSKESANVWHFCLTEELNDELIDFLSGLIS